ncbi:MAG: DUF5318 family protein [Actinomycetota bacterium]|nr:DUF5318 family protein [Actinomycetota bacterium]
MSAPRHSAIRGSVVRGQSSKPGKQGELPPAEHIADPTAPRSPIDFTLQRRAALLAFFRGGMLSSEFCDADPYLLKAAKFHGEPAGSACPVCKDLEFMHVTYVYGDQLGPYSGRVRQHADLPEMARMYGEFKVYVVEVCQRCHWNFLMKTFVLGDGVPRRAPRTPRDLIELEGKR